MASLAFASEHLAWQQLISKETRNSADYYEANEMPQQKLNNTYRSFVNKLPDDEQIGNSSMRRSSQPILMEKVRGTIRGFKMPRFPAPPRRGKKPIVRPSETASKVSRLNLSLEEVDFDRMSRVTERSMTSRAADLRSLGGISSDSRYIARLEEKIEAQRIRRINAENLLKDNI